MNDLKTSDPEGTDPVDRVLAGLGVAEPGKGMNGRILLAIAQPEIRQKGVRQWVAMAGVSAVVVLVSVSPALQRVHRGAPRQEAAVAAAQGMRPAPAHAVVPVTDAGSATDLGGRRVPSGVVTARRKLPVLQADTGSRAEAESFPAPPMPLTRQERLLLRMLSQPEGVQVVASLDGGAESAHERQEFERFFAPVYPASSFRRAEGKGDGNRVEPVPSQRDLPKATEHTTGELR